MKTTIVATISSSVLLSALLAGSAHAEPRTACWRLTFRDTRVDCPGPGTAGAKATCAPDSGFSDAVGHRVELWDKDRDGEDEHIGTWVITGPGVQCATFEWEDARYARGEANPDVYLVYRNEARNTSGTGAIVSARTAARERYAATTWRNGQGDEPDRFVAVECTPGRECDVFPGGYLFPTRDQATDVAQVIMAVDSAQKALQTFSTLMSSSTVTIEFPTTDPACTTACSYDQTRIGVPAGLAVDGDRLAHEMGHALQKQLFQQDRLRDDCSWGTPGWTMGTDDVEWQSCATTEGWAAYVGAVSWYEPNNFETVPFYGGQNLETAAPAQTTCRNNRWLPLQVAKAFWDIDDWNDERGASPAAESDDVTSYTTLSIARGWGNFASGTDDRQSLEEGRNAVNLWDYDFNIDVADETFFDHNCMQDQQR